jgi:hypothetical protein
MQWLEARRRSGQGHKRLEARGFFCRAMEGGSGRNSERVKGSRSDGTRGKTRPLRSRGVVKARYRLGRPRIVPFVCLRGGAQGKGARKAKAREVRGYNAKHCVVSVNIFQYTFLRCYCNSYSDVISKTRSSLTGPNLSPAALLSNFMTSTGVVTYRKLKIQLSLQFSKDMTYFGSNLKFSGYEHRRFCPHQRYTDLSRTLT